MGEGQALGNPEVMRLPPPRSEASWRSRLRSGGSRREEGAPGSGQSTGAGMGLTSQAGKPEEKGSEAGGVWRRRFLTSLSFPFVL